MNCAVVRDLLAERALGVSGSREREALDRHLAWCAACRKEASDLDRAAVTMAFALAPATPEGTLEARVVGALHGAADPSRLRQGPRASRSRGPRRRLLAMIVAASVGVGLIGGGAVFASRAGRVDPHVVADQQKGALQRFLDLVRSGEFTGDTTVLLGTLEDPSGTGAAGSAMAILTSSGEDRVLVMGAGLRASAHEFPYTVRLASGAGDVLEIGYLTSLRPDGGFTVARLTETDLAGYINVAVRNGHGRVVLTGTLREQTSLPSPAG